MQYRLILAVLLLFFASASADQLSFGQLKTKMTTLKTAFENPQLTRDQKYKYFPEANMLLGQMQLGQYSKAQNRERIKLAVEIVAATVKYDDPKSITETLYEDYVKHQAEYDKAIKELKSPEQQKLVAASFKNWVDLGDPYDPPTKK